MSGPDVPTPATPATPEPGPSLPAPEAPKRLWDHPMVRRLPLLLVAAVGFFFLLPKVPHDVEVDYDLGPLATGLQEVSIEVHDPSGQALQRSVLKGDRARHPVQHLRLPKGTYRVELRLSYADRVDRRERSFDVEEAERVDLDVAKP